jgi:hypothetical protein
MFSVSQIVYAILVECHFKVIVGSARNATFVFATSAVKTLVKFKKTSFQTVQCATKD